MPILGSSNSTEKKKKNRYHVKNMDKWGYNYLILAENIVGKRKNGSSRAISSFRTMFSNAVFC